MENGKQDQRKEIDWPKLWKEAEHQGIRLRESRVNKFGLREFQVIVEPCKDVRKQ